ncbi:hypothetical protein D3H35_18255 [Cohnella faecalis]|uniref:Uncharacterized protein n=1 Tax=Cohnella faecalis TaxID=2315694 RepID=A0A398CJV0_9BACL|nr:hypothetical protein D3H35_18255 [Cohnella faecalis]
MLIDDYSAFRIWECERLERERKLGIKRSAELFEPLKADAGASSKLASLLSRIFGKRGRAAQTGR